MNLYENGFHLCISVCIASFEQKCLRRFDFYHNLKIQLWAECALFILSNVSKYAQKSVELLIYRSFFTLLMITFANDVNYKMFGCLVLVAISQRQLKICITFWYITFASGLFAISSRQQTKKKTRMWILCVIIDGCVFCVPVCSAHCAAYPVNTMVNHMRIKLNRWSPESVGIVKRSDNLFIMASESIIIKSWVALTFWNFIFFCSSRNAFSCLLFLWLVSRCHFLFILNCLLLNNFSFSFACARPLLVLCLSRRYFFCFCFFFLS